MSCDFLALAQPGVQKLSPYVPGKPVDELARELNLDPAGIVKLASNENPLGPSSQVLAAIQAALPELTRYPDGNGFELKHALAVRYGVTAAQVTLGNGSNDILDLVARAYLATQQDVFTSLWHWAVSRRTPSRRAPTCGVAALRQCLSGLPAEDSSCLSAC